MHSKCTCSHFANKDCFDEKSTRISWEMCSIQSQINDGDVGDVEYLRGPFRVTELQMQKSTGLIFLLLWWWDRHSRFSIPLLLVLQKKSEKFLFVLIPYMEPTSSSLSIFYLLLYKFWWMWKGLCRLSKSVFNVHGPDNVWNSFTFYWQATKSSLFSASLVYISVLSCSLFPRRFSLNKTPVGERVCGATPKEIISRKLNLTARDRTVWITREFVLI